MRKIKFVTTVPLLAVLLAGAGTATVNSQSTQVEAATKKTPPKMLKGKKPNKKPGKKMGTPPSMPKGKSMAGKGGPNTHSYDYKGTLKATLNVKSGSKSVTKKTISNNKQDQNTALTSKATGANGIFATNKGTINVSNTSIKTTGKANSRGLDATYGGKINANNVNISTKGDHSAAVATDRGGGTVNVKNSKLSTKGSGSPLAYSTGNITFENVTGTAEGSQLAGMEGYNKISLLNSKLTSTNNKISGSDPIKNGVIIY